MDFSFTEIIGYIASLTILVSFLMKDIITLRIVNCVGAALFIVYGVMLNNSIPIIFTNAAIMAINIYYLLKAKRSKA